MSLHQDTRHPSESWDLMLQALPFVALDPSLRWGDEGVVK